MKIDVSISFFVVLRLMLELCHFEANACHFSDLILIALHVFAIK